ncbi:uncharacterized protein [Montipora capricornis]|uniref:uncharacterized protein n=1 Tax=Montipora capricornis TaxID=246305 RepID=UPI0035F1A52B
MDTDKGTYTYTDDDVLKCHVPIKRVSSLSQLQTGRHIAKKGSVRLYWHHAIVENVDTEEGIVNAIEYSNGAGGFLRDNISPPKNPGKAKVMRGKYRLEDNLYLIEHEKCLPADEVVSRARSRLGEREYHLLKNNCEHFAMWCKTGRSLSEQAKEKEKEAKENGPPTVVGLLAKPGEEMVTMLRAGAKGATLLAIFSSLPKDAQDMLLNGAQKVAADVCRQYLANAQFGAQMARNQFLIESLSKYRQAMMLNGSGFILKQLEEEVFKKGTRMAAKEIVAQTVSNGGEVVKQTMKETTRKAVAETSKTTGTSAGGSLMGAAACGALVEGAIGLYDISCAKANLEAGKISQDEYDDAFGKRIMSGVGNVIGSTAGAALVQVLIPLPGAGLLGSWLGGKIGRSWGN